jgi:hypothetical protein
VIAVLTLAVERMPESVATGAAYVEEFTNAIRRVQENEITEWIQTLQQAVPPV